MTFLHHLRFYVADGRERHFLGIQLIEAINQDDTLRGDEPGRDLFGFADPGGGDRRLSEKASRPRVDPARAVLARRRITSPINGIVVNRNLSPGEFAADDERIVTIATVDPLCRFTPSLRAQSD